MRRAAKVDANQQEIVDDLRKLGYSVHVTHRLGGGFPDIVVGKGDNYLFEVKNPEYDCNLTSDEKDFFDTWRGQVDVITTTEDALQRMQNG